MTIPDFLKAIGSVSGSWSLAAYSIAAVLAIGNLVVSRSRKESPNSIIWGIVAVICVLGLTPTIANAYLERLRIIGAVYRIRTTVLSPEHFPVSGAILHTTASNQTTETSQGIGEVTVPRATMPADGKITIYADLDAQFLHGHADIQLANDPNPSVSIELRASGDAVISGLVEDSAGHAVPDATVSVLGGASGVTAANGTFKLTTNAAAGQMVRLHVEKKGYPAVDQDHPAGRDPATIVLTRVHSAGKKAQR